MPSIDEVLEAATPRRVSPPTVDQLNRILHRRARRRRNFGLVVVCVAVGMVGLGVVARLGVGQRIESVAEEPVIGDERSTSAGTSTTSEPSAEQTTTTALPAWVNRWFLVPPEPTEISQITSQPGIWDEAQGPVNEAVFVTSDPLQPATAGLGRIYHLDGIGIFRIGSPDWDYYETTIAGRQLRIGNDPTSDQVNAFVASDTGSFVVVGVDLSDDQAAKLVLAAELVNGATQVDELPQGFTEVSLPQTAPTDHRTTIGWTVEGADFNLRITPSSLEEQVLYLRFVDAEITQVRGTQGIYTPTVPGMNPASLVWAQDGYTLILSKFNDQAPGDLDALVALADSLQRVDQPELIERLGDPFMARQASTVAEWLETTPPPKGWDTTTLVNSVPQDELTIASFTRQFLECTWTAEWAEAIRSNDPTRRDEAEATLARQATWPSFQAEMDALRRLDERAAESVDQEAKKNIDVLADRRAAVQDLEQLAAFEGEYGCGFTKPTN